MFELIAAVPHDPCSVGAVDGDPSTIGPVSVLSAIPEIPTLVIVTIARTDPDAAGADLHADIAGKRR